MHRKYRPWHYREKIEKIRAAMPTAAIGADVMVGFPGETDAEFEETRRMIEELPFTYLHVFTYSPRPGTPAATMERSSAGANRSRPQPDSARVGWGEKAGFHAGLCRQGVDAIMLKLSNDGEFTEALTDNYLKVRLRGRHEANRWPGARIGDVAGEALVGWEL